MGQLFCIDKTCFEKFLDHEDMKQLHDRFVVYHILAPGQVCTKNIFSEIFLLTTHIRKICLMQKYCQLVNSVGRYAYLEMLLLSLFTTGTGS